MLPRLDAPTEIFLADLRAIGRRVERAQRAVASGRRLNRVSDAPGEVRGLLQLRTELRQTERIRANLGRVRTEVDAAEQALQAAVKVMERAEVLGAQGANGTLSAAERRMIAVEVETLIEQMAGLARSRIEGRYIFSGDADNQPPYTLDLTLDDPFSGYQGTPATRLAQHPDGTAFAIAHSADVIFDHPDPEKNALEAVNGLRLALRNDDITAIQDALGRLDTAGTYLNEQLAFYGAVQNEIAEAVDLAHRQELRLATRISEIEDADLMASILDLDAAQHQQEVALTVQARMNPRSLFDYLA